MFLTTLSIMQQNVKSPEISLTIGEIVKSEGKNDIAFRTVNKSQQKLGHF